jgi:hypothetical protein
MASSFLASLDRNILRVKQEVNDKVYRISIELFLAIVARTPSPANPGDYAKGLLANQWYPKLGDFSDEVGTDKSPTAKPVVTAYITSRARRGILRQRRQAHPHQQHQLRIPCRSARLACG